MKLNKESIVGFFIAVACNIIGLIVIYAIWFTDGSFLFFLQSSWQLKSIVGYLTITAIPSVIIFSYFLQKNKHQYAQGILIELMVLVIFLIILKFFIK